MSRIEPISPQQVRLDLIARREMALFDLREEAPFAAGHPLFAAQISAGSLELDILDRAPRKTVRIVLYDDGEGLVDRAAGTLGELGYTNLCVLTGGLQGWVAAGYELFADVNSYSKAFGELVEHRRGTPSVPAAELNRMIEGGEDLVVLDARPFDEYRVMSIPTATNVPGAELVLRAKALAPNPGTRIVVNCAGRTRSLIGAQSLINAGLPNPVVALRNGTIGWTLAGLNLDRGQARRHLCAGVDDLEAAQARARDVAYRAGVRRLDAAGLEALAADADRTLYRFDVRPTEDYLQGHWEGFRTAPGGQLVQEIDVFAPVRGARIVLFDDLRARADMTASWLAQMGWEVYVIDATPSTPVRGDWRPQRPPIGMASEITTEALVAGLADERFTIVDFASSPVYARGHIPGAWFAIRAQLGQAIQHLPGDRRLVFTSPDGALACLGAADAGALGIEPPLVLRGGTDAWIAAGLPMETGLDRQASEAIDVYRRPYEGVNNTDEAMQGYIDWELGLVEQLERDASHGFFVV